MRKITSKNEEETKSRKKQFIAGGVLIFIMLASILGYSFRANPSDNPNERIIYNGIEFIRQNDFWFASINGLQFAFSFSPKETESISSSIFSNINSYSAKPLYIYSDSENYGAEIEIYRNLDQLILRRQYACLEGENCTGDFPVKTCADNFIIFKESEESKITQENNCIYIQGEKEELVKITDKFLFRILGVQ